MDRVDCVVIGAGVVGLAVARALARHGREVIIIEAADSIGSETSSRNNEVIHAGFLYPSGTLKARLCRPGRDLLYRYCEERGIPHRRVGKLVIATSEEEARQLDRIAGALRDMDVADVIRIDGSQARQIEPEVSCEAALYSLSTGIVDAHALMLSLLGDAEDAGASVVYRTRVTGGSAAGGDIVIETSDTGQGRFRLSCRTLVNAAGLGARDVALALAGAETRPIPSIHLAKGNFFAFSGRPPFGRIIAPLGATLELGGAFTIDMGGQGKFGPDVEWVERVDYRVDPAREAGFAAAIRRYYPGLADGALRPDYSGIRPRPDRAAVTDWLVLGPGDHGVAGVHHLLGFDTPGLTACLAIADHVAERIGPA
jgi:L-2-hydroxyglutarate oxidase LhgO